MKGTSEKSFAYTQDIGFANHAVLSGRVHHIGSETNATGVPVVSITIEQIDHEGGSVEFDIYAFGNEHVEAAKGIKSGENVLVSGEVFQKVWPFKSKTRKSPRNTQLALQIQHGNKAHYIRKRCERDRFAPNNLATLKGQMIWSGTVEAVHEHSVKIRRSLIICPVTEVTGRFVRQQLTIHEVIPSAGKLDEIKDGDWVELSGHIENRVKQFAASSLHSGQIVIHDTR